MNHSLMICEGKPEGTRVFMGIVGCLVGFGLPAAAFSEGGWFEVFKLGLFCAPFGLCGLLLLFQASGAWIDLDTREFVSWSRFFSHRKQNRLPLSSFKEVAVIRRYVENRGDRYVVRLLADQDLDGIQYSGDAVLANSKVRYVSLYQYADCSQAAAKATELAKLLELPLGLIET